MTYQSSWWWQVFCNWGSVLLCIKIQTYNGIDEWQVRDKALWFTLKNANTIYVLIKPGGWARSHLARLLVLNWLCTDMTLDISHNLLDLCFITHTWFWYYPRIHSTSNILLKTSSYTSPCGSRRGWRKGQTFRTEKSRHDTNWLLGTNNKIIYCLLCSKKCCRCLNYINSLDPHKDSTR